MDLVDQLSAGYGEGAGGGMRGGKQEGGNTYLDAAFRKLKKPMRAAVLKGADHLKMLLGIMAWMPLVPSTACVTLKSTATLHSA